MNNKQGKIFALSLGILVLSGLTIATIAYFIAKPTTQENPTANPTQDTPIPPIPPQSSPISPKPTPTEPKIQQIVIEPRQIFTSAQNAPRLATKNPPRMGEEIYGTARGQLSCSIGAYIVRKNRVFLLTAEHCGEGVFYAKNKKKIGKSIKKFPQEGLQIIRLEAVQRDRSIVVRHYNKEISPQGIHEPKIGERVCRTGAQSGTICNLIISRTKVNNVDIENEEEKKNNLIELSIEPGHEQYATGLGDSGGIVYRIDENENLYVVGVLIGGGGEEKECDISVGRCFTKTYAYPIKDFLENNNEFSLYYKSE